MAVDLHTHSTASDGTELPVSVVALASAAGLSWVSLTDHDTLQGIEEARRAAEKDALGFIAGIELSVRWQEREIHLLSYFLEPGSGPLQDRLGYLRAGRVTRAERTVARLRTLGYEIDFEAVLAQVPGDSVGRPHIADALVAAGHFASRSEVFTALLHDGGPAFVPRDLLDVADAVTLARASGAVTVLAHPYTIGVGRREYEEAFRSLAAHGIQGIEAHHPEHSPGLRTHLEAIARDLDLVATGGSDFHGSGKLGIAVGSGRGDLNVPDSVVGALIARRP